MAVDRRDANLKVLNEAEEIQQKTKETVFKIQRQAEEVLSFLAYSHTLILSHT
jgi:hypothetical protein